MKALIENALESLGALAADIGMESLATELRTTRLEKLREERFVIVVLGEFNHGKSTFVNALVGAPLLPAGITPTTATINHVVYSDEPRAQAVLADGKIEQIPIDKLADWVTIDGKRAEAVRHVEIGWPAPLLKDRVTLVDTPGVNDINEQRAEITYGYVPRADAVIFLLDGAQVLKQSERSFLETRILRRSRDRLLFVLGKIDLLTPDEREEALRYCREHLGHIVDEPLLFPVSAKRALSKEARDREASGFPALTAHLQQYLTTERKRVLFDNTLTDALRTAAYLKQTLGIKRRSLELDVEELEARIERVRSQLHGTQANLRAHHAKIRAQSDAIKAELRHDLDDFVTAFNERLPGELDRVDADDIKHFLAPFIEECWKRWAEDEGDKVGARLERMAEEIIQVTNENVADAIAIVNRELGLTDERIEVDVDTLKYDVGVLALGAVGTGIFLFLNTLVGGLLTLAAPVIAIVLRERISGEIKARAKEAVAEANTKAAALIGPKFEQIIEDFHGRLGDFLVAAGDALHRGIGEVLDQALSERKERDGDSSTRNAELEALAKRLAVVEQELQQLRGDLWASSTASTDSPTS